MGNAAVKITPQEENEKVKDQKPALKLVKNNEVRADLSPAAERFLKEIKADWPTFSRLVRNLLRVKNKQQKQLLRAVEITLENALLTKLVDEFDTQERAQWRLVSTYTFSEALDMERCYDRLRLELRKSHLANSGEESLSSMVASMHEERALDFVKKYPRSGPALLQRVSADIAAAVLNGLTNEEVRSVVDLSLADSPQDEEKKLKQELSEFLSGLRGAFKQGLPEAVVELSQEKGDAVLNSLLECGEWGLVRSMALKTLPPALFPRIQNSTLRQAMMPIEIEDKVAFLATRLSDEDETIWSNLMSEEGSKSREMLNLELEQIKSNPDSLTALQSQRSQIEKRFYTKIRDFLNKEEYQSQVVSVVDSWIAEEKATYNI